MKISKVIEKFIRIMDERGLTELEIEDENFKLKICRPEEQYNIDNVKIQDNGSSAPIKEDNSVKTNVVELCSPLVGIFYASPEGDSKKYLNIGDIIYPSQILGRVKVVDVNNDIRAEIKGKVTDILVKDGQPVEYDQPLFLIEPIEEDEEKEYKDDIGI
jgi:biotin carboxyl carrier protein